MGSTPILLSHSSNPCLSEFGVPVMEHRACPQEESVIRIRQLPGALLHEHSCGMRGDAGDLHTARGQFHYHEHVVRDEAVPRRHLFEACATEGLCQRGETTAFCVGQAQPPTAKLSFKDKILLMQIGDDLLLVTLEPSSDHGDQDVEAHGCSSGWRYDDLVRSSILPT